MNQHPEKRRTRSLSKSLVDLAKAVADTPDTVYDLVIVGSGYGGSVAAQQLAGMKAQGTSREIRICVLERGNEYLPGMFPSTFAELPGHLRLGMQGSGHVGGRHEGLFDLRPGRDVGVLVANGLGGGSLINAGVMIKPEFDQFESRLPAHVVAELNETYLEAARTLLVRDPLLSHGGGNSIERHADFSQNYPLKYHRLGELAEGQGKPLTHHPAEITVAMAGQAAHPHSVGLSQCNGCGDCMTGCNVGAKASLDTNLLAQARLNGVEIYTGASVLSLSREKHDPKGEGHWVLDVVHTLPALRVRAADSLKLKARKVILAAGTLGSTEILLRSRSDTLGFSNMLGERFSCNGDNIAAIHGMQKAARCTADEHQALSTRQVGPTITNVVKVPCRKVPGQSKDKVEVELGFLIQEFAVPAPLKRLFAELVTTGHAISQLPEGDHATHGGEPGDAPDPCAVDDCAICKTLLVGLIGHDDAAGALRLPHTSAKPGEVRPQQGTLEIVWPQARDGKHLNAAHQRLVDYAKKAFDTAHLVTNPMWRLVPTHLEMLVDQQRGPVMTVHPLGGCVMGTHLTNGVVNEFGMVFNADDSKTDGWEGSLIVLDGSIVPGSLGANPALTISALALRAIGALKNKWKLGAGGTLLWPKALPDRPRFAPARPSTTVAPKPTEVEVIERLSGKVHLNRTGSPHEQFIVELTLRYRPVKLAALMTHWGGRTLAIDAKKSLLRVFPVQVWEQSLLRVQDDAEKEKHVVWKAHLDGTLRILHREASTPVWRVIRSFLAYLFNRGVRDFWQALASWFAGVHHPDSLDPQRPKSDRNLISRGLEIVKNLWNMAAKAGEVRRFDYDLWVCGPNLIGTPGASQIFGVTGQSSDIRGHKRLTYNCRANPWQQLTELTLTHMPFMPKGAKAKLTLDTRFLANQGVALVQLCQQQNQPNALLDLASFGLFAARMLVNIHFWTLRKPDPQTASPPQRLPSVIGPDMPKPEITELTVALRVQGGGNAMVRLTRYARHASEKPPLAMIHGYSANGTTFTHPSLKPSAAEFFWRQERDVWVIDLRSSSGMPTATRHWSFEEVALVDIPAALLHIKNVTGRPVDVLAHCIGAAMLSMAILTDARRVQSGETELGVNDRITPSQLGTLSAFNGDGRSSGAHPTVRTIVLSQKGPLLRYTEANIFRGYLMRYLRRWLLPDGYQFRPSERPKVVEQLLDRLLSAVPYPDADYDIENPVWPCAKTPWTATRHRMDALYAQVFSAANLSPATLDAIDDLFGPINLDTLAQTIHFVRFNCITNQRGRGEFVTLERLTQRWRGIATLSVYGTENGMVDVTTQDLLKANFQAAGVAFCQRPYPGLGHQDLLIGRTSSAVFRDIEAFLRNPPSLPVARPAQEEDARWSFATPWIGPRLERSKGIVRVHALSSPRFGRARLVLLPCSADPANCLGVPPTPSGLLSASIEGSSCGWLTLDLPPGPVAAGTAGWLVVVAYPVGQTTARELVPSDVGANHPQAGHANQTGFPYLPSLRRAAGCPVSPDFVDVTSPGFRQNECAVLDRELASWLDNHKPELSECFVSGVDADGLGRDATNRFAFSLGSCQYPAGLLDRPLAEHSLARLATEFRRENRPDFAIFTGDQIYADATAGLADPVRRDERFDLPYEYALKSKPMREIMRRVPVHMMLDDHEISDNWEPSSDQHKGASALADRLHRHGLRAYWHYQRMLKPTENGLPDVSYTFGHGRALFYMLDTRSQRQYREPGKPWSAHLLPAPERQKLADWLCQNPEKLKFIVTPAMLLPRRLSMLNNSLDQASRSDAGDGYPADVHDLFELIVDNGINNTVFLSGDEHLSCVATATLSMPGKAPRKILSIHASGLYAPLPFANSVAEDFINGTESFPLGKVTCLTTTKFAQPGNNFAMISVDSTNPRPFVTVQFNGHLGDSVFGRLPL